MEAHLLELIVVNAPNYIGFALLVIMQWRIINLLLNKIDDSDD